jgi:hypothetical protein
MFPFCTYAHYASMDRPWTEDSKSDRFLPTQPKPYADKDFPQNYPPHALQMLAPVW